MILRGSRTGPNYAAENVAELVREMERVNIGTKIMIDCSHGNAQKSHVNQAKVLQGVCQQLLLGGEQSRIGGVMIESNLVAGRQDLPQNAKDLHDLVYGQSVTDSCVGWTETELMLRQLRDCVQQRRRSSTSATAKQQ